MSLKSWAEASWNKLRARTNLDDGSHARPVDRQELAVILDRLGLLDHSNGPAIGHAARLMKRMNDADSSDAYVREVIAHLRDHPTSAGVDADRVREVARDELGRARITPS